MHTAVIVPSNSFFLISTLLSSFYPHDLQSGKMAGEAGRVFVDDEANIYRLPLPTCGSKYLSRAYP
jgi:hypothetical protein